MVLSRVTSQTMHRSTLANLQLNMRKMSELQNKYSSGVNISKASDDPGGTADSLRLRSDMRAVEQYQRNTADGIGWLTTIDTSVTGAIAQLRRARDLTVQGASTGTLGQEQREALATEIESVRSTIMDQANATYLGRSVFAGTSDAGYAFDSSYNFTGTPGTTVERRTGPSTTVRADADGAGIFGQGATSVFAMLDTIAAELRAGTAVTSRLDDIDTAMAQMLAHASDVGARYNQLELAQTQSLDKLVTIKKQLSTVDDVDLPGIMIQVQMQQVAYQGALNAAAKGLTPTLLDFLR